MREMSANNSFLQIYDPDESGTRRHQITHPFSMTYVTCDGNHITFLPVYPGNAEYSPHVPGNTEMHQHDYFELFYILDGDVLQYIESSALHYHKGEAILMNRSIRHCESSSTPFSGVFLNIRPEYIADILEHDRITTPDQKTVSTDGSIHQFLFSNLREEEQYTRSYLHFSATLQLESSSEPQCRAEQLLDQLAEELLGQKNGVTYMISGLLARLIGTLENPRLYHVARMEWNSDNEDFIYAHIVNYLKERKGNLTREELSHALHYHAEYLNQITKRKSGMSLMQLGRTFRLEEAKRLLTETTLSISDIVQELGYVSRSHFYRFFEKETGMLPMEYRQHAGK